MFASLFLMIPLCGDNEPDRINGGLLRLVFLTKLRPSFSNKAMCSNFAFLLIGVTNSVFHKRALPAYEISLNFLNQGVYTQASNLNQVDVWVYVLAMVV